MATALEVATALSKVMGYAHDGALDKEGNPVKFGLRREEKEWTVRDRRIIDGFKVKLQGDSLILNYHSECLVKELHDKKFAQKVEDIIDEVVKNLKKEYKKVADHSLKLKKKGDVQVFVESSSKVRTWVRAQCVYEIGNMDIDKPEKRDLDKSIRDWIKLGKNDSRGY